MVFSVVRHERLQLVFGHRVLQLLIIIRIRHFIYRALSIAKSNLNTTTVEVFIQEEETGDTGPIRSFFLPEWTNCHTPKHQEHRTSSCRVLRSSWLR